MEASTKAAPDRVSEEEHRIRHLQYIEKGPRMSSPKPWRMGETNPRLPTMDQVMLDATKAATKMTGQVYDLSTTHHVDRPPTDGLTDQGEVMMFHRDTLG